MVKLKASLSLSRAENIVMIPPSDRHFVPWRSRDPIKSSLFPVVGLDGGPVNRRLPCRLVRHGVNLHNLRPLPRAPPAAAALEPAAVRVALVNARSLANKTFILKDFFNTNELDFLCITETWMSVSESSALCEPSDCTFFNSPRTTGRGGGIATRVVGPTQEHGHTLDLVLTHGFSVANLEVYNASFSDHMPVVFDFLLPCPVVKKPKVERTRALIHPPLSNPSNPITPPAVLDQFEPVGLPLLKNIVGHTMKPSGSPKDLLPPRLFKEVFPTVAPDVLNIINSSLINGTVPDGFKHAVVQPLIKKPGLDISVLSNFRPISKLPFISKILEKVVFSQLNGFLDEQKIFEVFQSGFKTQHSTETALLKVFNDVLLATDSGHCVILVLLDLTAAFDTVDHDILLSRLKDCVGIQGSALQWFRSYLTGRSFNVRVGSAESSAAPLTCGVAQGSILAPLLFSLYLLPLGSILRKHGVSFHFYADDSQIYMPLKQNQTHSVQKLLDCVEEIKSWLSANLLHFNDTKTEVILFGPSDASAADIDLGVLTQYQKSTVTNLGVKLDSNLKLDAQISAAVKASFFQLRQLAKAKPFLSRHHFEILIHAFITNRLDYCNALYYGLSQASLAQLQLVQNAAARLLTGAKKREHITPILKSLHWLPIPFRIDFKFLLFVFKSLHGLAPQYLSDMLQPHCPARSLRSADQSLLVVPKTQRIRRGDRSFSVAGPKLWNKLPLHLRQM
ncbi:uncharacterized protein LOC114443003, partial [Parambassis ranga]|uniref:Uncharacterized protein LOC114443003 n=1 Tax=Parambassis ranga TaxID=210632 RepID=A0A6P7J7Y7_9TELE